MEVLFNIYLQTSAATTLSYLSSQVLYLGSLTGDSQLLRICPSPHNDINSDTLPIPSGISTISSSALGAPRAESPDDDYDMRDVMDTRETRGGKVVKNKGNHIEVLASFKNIAPILDAVLADPDESGQVRISFGVCNKFTNNIRLPQTQIVTCSGGSNTGSLNIVRPGADFQELAMLGDLPNITNIWPIRAHYHDS